MSTRIRLLPAAALVALLLALTIAGARAVDGAEFDLSPLRADQGGPEVSSHFDLKAVPGQTIHDEVVVTNSGMAAGTARLYAVAAATATTSGIVYGARGDPPQGVGAWIRLDRQEVTLVPGGTEVVGFTVTVPADARPGQHLGALAVEAAVPQAPSGATSVPSSRTPRMIVAMQIDVPGPTVEQIAVTGVRYDEGGTSPRLEVWLRNDGTDMVRPHGELAIRDAGGHAVRTLRLELDTLLPDTAIGYPVALTGKPLAPGDYLASVTLSYGDRGTTSADVPLSVPGQPASAAVQPTSAAGRAARPSMGLILAGFALGFAAGIAATVVAGSALHGRRAAMPALPLVHRPTAPTEPSVARRTTPATPTRTIRPLVPPIRQLQPPRRTQRRRSTPLPNRLRARRDTAR